MQVANANPPLERICLKCGCTKPLSEFYAHPFGLYGVGSRCKDCTKAYARLRRKDPAVAEQLREYDRRRRSTPEARAKRRSIMKKRRKANLLYNLHQRIRGFLARTLKGIGKEKSGRTSTILGYGPDELKKRIECQFKPGMSWNNYSHSVWHIDHKKPIAAFIQQGITDARTINMLCNLQPMWANENHSKNSKWEPPVAANDNAKIRTAA